MTPRWTSFFARSYGRSAKHEFSAEGRPVRQDERAPFVTALHRARDAAYPAGEYVGQESLMLASEIRRLVGPAGIGPGSEVLDVCCGTGGPGRHITRELDCRYLGLDYSASALEIARELAGDLPCRFERARVPPLPRGRFEVVLLLETLLAFRDKGALLAEVAEVMEAGGRFACTVEAGAPLTADERARMPDADTVWPIELSDLTALLSEVGLTVSWTEHCSAAHYAMAAAMLHAFRADADEIRRQIGTRALSELIAAHELWTDWLRCRRIRKYMLVAYKN
jgi:ubiquinone/menaquinone biosynthesis C-methylase UbiE